jgi:hypothetical protein
MSANAKRAVQVTVGIEAAGIALISRDAHPLFAPHALRVSPALPARPAAAITAALLAPAVAFAPLFLLVALALAPALGVGARKVDQCSQTFSEQETEHRTA